MIPTRGGRILTTMPIYEYAPTTPPGCALCCYGFEVMQSLSEPRLTLCPACGGAVQPVLGAPATIVGQAHVLREAHVAKHGFTQYRRNGKGHYEKITGDGPDSISSGD